MYKIIGADQKEYGPITAEQMQQWIAEGRVNAQTLVWSETSGNWKPLSSYPELAGSIPGYVPGAVPPNAPTYGLGGDRSSALEKVNGPAIGLFVTAGFGLLGAAAGIVMTALGVGMGTAEMGEMGNDPAMKQIMSLMSGFGVFQYILHFILAIFIFFGANKMRKLESYGFALATAIIALVPCFSPCCWLGVPIGIWAIIVLNKPEVKSHFSK